MAQVKISALTAADPLTGVEEAPFVQGGATKKATTEQIREYVASQPNVFSVTQRIEDAAPALQFSENDTVDQNWEFIGVSGALRLDELNDAFSTTGTHHTFTHGGGTQFGSPTGGDQGAGTVNAVELYQDGVGVPTLDGGADANFTAMPQVEGDPVVESGSNSDGEWTRWADGTQQCSHIHLITSNVDTDLHGTWSFPTAFINPPKVTGTVIDFRDVAGADAGGNNIERSNFGVRSRTAGAVATRAYATTGAAFTSGDVAGADILATGRWK